MTEKAKIPAEWKTQHRKRQTEKGEVLDGTLAGGDIVGSFVVAPEGTIVTIATMRADWLVRVMAPTSLEDCLEAALLAAERAGVATR